MKQMDVFMKKPNTPDLHIFTADNLKIHSNIKVLILKRLQIRISVDVSHRFRAPSRVVKKVMKALGMFVTSQDQKDITGE